jgi:hypothetical protein
MPTPPLSKEKMREAVEALRQHGSTGAAAKALNLDPGTFRSRLRRAEAAGMHLSPGALDAVTEARLDPAEARGGWIVQVDEDGNRKSTYWRREDVAPEDFAARICEAIEGLPPKPAITPPTTCDGDLLTLYPIADAHIGMLAWRGETGEDYSTAKAARRVMEWVGQAVDASPASETAVILDVGDLLHADDTTGQTPRSKHALDTDTRHYRTVEMTIACLASAIEYAAEKHARVIVRVLPGNHDPHAYLAVLFALRERYRLSPQIEVEAQPGEFWVHEHGQVMLCAHHGDKGKPERLAHWMADEHAPIWGRTRFRHLYTGHLHHHRSAEIGGLIWEQLPALCARDAYAVSNAYSGRAALQTITFHRQRGEVQRFKVTA